MHAVDGRQVFDNINLVVALIALRTKKSDQVVILSKDAEKSLCYGTLEFNSLYNQLCACGKITSRWRAQICKTLADRRHTDAPQRSTEAFLSYE